MVRCVSLPIFSFVFFLLILAATYVSFDRWLLSLWSPKTSPKITTASGSVQLRLSPSTQFPIHTLADDRLFQQASLATTSNEFYPAVCIVNVDCKLSLLFLTRGPLPLARLWERWLSNQDGLYSIYIHAEPVFKLGSEYPEMFHDREIPSQVSRQISKVGSVYAGNSLMQRLMREVADIFWQFLDIKNINDSEGNQGKRYVDFIFTRKLRYSTNTTMQTHRFAHSLQMLFPVPHATKFSENTY